MGWGMPLSPSDVISPSGVITGRSGGFQTRPDTRGCPDFRYEGYGIAVVVVIEVIARIRILSQANCRRFSDYDNDNDCV